MIKYFTVMSTLTNEPLRYCQCVESDKEIIVNEGEYLVEGRQQPNHSGNDVLNSLRLLRRDMLADCDWTQVADSPLSDAAKQQYLVYRQALRDLPDSVGDIETLSDVEWPIQPGI